MENKPTNQVTDATKQRPKLVIFDDKLDLLTQFTARFTELGYAVIPVFVPPRRDAASFVNDNGTMNKVLLQRAIADARQTLKNEPNNATAKNDIDIYKRMKALTYGASNEAGVLAILDKIKPDCVLSDMQMYEAGKLEGQDVMRIVGQWNPKTPKAIHTSLYTDEDWLQTEEGQACHTEDAAAAKAGGYIITAKDSKFSDISYSSKVHDYFKKQLARGRSEGPTPA